MMDLNSRRKYYCKIYGQCYSNCGRFVACCDCYGRISFFNLDQCLSKSSAADSVKFPSFLLSDFHSDGDKSEPIFAMASSEKFLLCGDALGRLYGFAWSDLEKKRQETKPSFSYCCTAGPSSGFAAEVNSIITTPDGDALVTGGAGDNAVKIWSLEDGHLMRSMEGHTDYIHDMCWKSENELVSVSEDGAVKIWDVRERNPCVHTLTPSKTSCNRPTLGPWIGCVAVSGQWLVCGGGPALGIWSLTAMGLATILSTNDTDLTEHHAAIINEDLVTTGGSKPKLFQWNLRGDLAAEIPVNGMSIYDISQCSSKNKVITCCGASSKVDLFISPQYKAFSMDVFP